MIVYSIISFLASLIYLHIGLYAYGLNSKCKVNRVFLLLCVSIALWSFAYAFAYLASDVYSFSFWNKVSAFGWCTFSAIALDLVLNITKNKYVQNKIVTIIIYIPAFIFLYMVIFLFSPDIKTTYLVEQLFYKGNFWYNFGYLLCSILIIYRWGRLSEQKIVKRQARIIVITSSIPFVLNLITQDFLGALGFKQIPLMGQIYMMISILGVYYIITKYGFMQIPNSILAEEMLTEVMDLTFLLDPEGNIIKISKHTFELLGYSLEELINRPITYVLKDKVVHEMHVNRNWGKDVSRFQELQCANKKGELIPVSISCTPIVDESSERLLGILIVGQDIRLLKQLNNEIRGHQETAKKLENSEEIFKLMVEIMPLGLVLTRKVDEKVIYINENTEKMFGVRLKDVVGRPSASYYFDTKDREEIFYKVKEMGFIKDKETLLKKANGEHFWCNISAVSAKYKGEEVLLNCINDINEKKLMQQSIAKSQELFNKLIMSLPDPVVITDLEGRITYANDAAPKVGGYEKSDEIVGKNIFSMIHKSDIEKAKGKFIDMLLGTQEPVEYTMVKKDGTSYRTEVNADILRNEKNEPYGMIFVGRDITKRKEVEDKLRKAKEEIEIMNSELSERNSQLIKANLELQDISKRDSLTNLYNHQYINERLEDEISKAKFFNHGLWVMMIDIDFFKRVNDTYGHQVGDWVIVTLCRIIDKCTREKDLLGRYGGEEFVVVLPDLNKEDALAISESIRKKVEDYIFDIETLRITVSIGLTEYINDDDSKAVIKRADMLLYEAKKNGRNRVEYIHN
ncbi:response regulator PleD [Clostridium homopropionicum DSM 5847]|uniref:Response regulator PleD n=1 Tax=Clostridium homopropionicum DSM 5847 TaxID=1121318 RepID=A0A0L6Z9U5_9CLOT|nr:diguanylate cyclase [Clostridium homopropionicum]KOA19741.1 response regulator PleD [Clostridium homopropionicum DSM 5847]SFF78552.1 PAS domain S-box-containing protein/diguanylate cyclase (GGDEF) domain-containing protein [Clostridium homopropionicum]